MESLFEFREVPVRDLLEMKSDFQRPLSKSRVKQLVAEWDDALFEPPTVAETPWGNTCLVEGQHRSHAFAGKYGEDAKVTVRVIKTSVPGSVFIRLSRGKKAIQPAVVFRAQLADRDPVAEGAYMTVLNHGFDIASAQDARVLNGVRALYDLHQANPVALDRALGVVEKIMDIRGGDRSEGWQRGNCFSALHYIISKVPEVDDRRLILVLSKITGYKAAPFNANQYRKNAEIILGEYNRNKRGGRISIPDE